MASNVEDLSTLEIEVLLLTELDFIRNLIVPNVTALSGLVEFETDILLLTKNDHTIGFEIKVSKADLKNDLKKRHIKSANTTKGIKHYYGKLKKFCYVVPSSLVADALTQVPEFCGIYSVKKQVVKSTTTTKKSTIKLELKEVRAAKSLSSYKWTATERYKLARLGAMRIKSLKENILKLTK